MLVNAMKLRVGDILSDGHIVASLSRSQGHTYVVLEDGRHLEVPDHYVLGVTRPSSSPVEASESSQGSLARN